MSLTWSKISRHFAIGKPNLQSAINVLNMLRLRPLQPSTDRANRFMEKHLIHTTINVCGTPIRLHDTPLSNATLVSFEGHSLLFDPADQTFTHSWGVDTEPLIPDVEPPFLEELVRQLNENFARRPERFRQLKAQLDESLARHALTSTTMCTPTPDLVQASTETNQATKP
jgi:hypothetical protein